MRHLFLVAAILLVAVPAQAQSAPAPNRVEGPDGAAVFQKACASCHANPGPDSRAPTREVLRTVAPEAILTALTVGNMFRQGSEITDAERRAVAAFLAGRPVGTAPPPSIVGRCQAQPAPLQASALNSGWNGWGADAANTRFQPAAKAGLNAASVPRLKLKWAYGFAGVNSARSQPAVLGGRLFVASDNGDVVALDAKRGCQVLELSRAGGHPHGGQRRSVQDGDDERLRGVLLGRRRDRLRDRCEHRPRDLAAQARRPYLRARDRLADRVSGSRLRADRGRRRRGSGRYRALRVLHVPRQRVGARCLDGSGDLEVVHDHRRAETETQERVRRADVGTRRRRRLGRTDDRSRASSRVRHDGQQLLRTRDQHDRRGHRDGHGYRQTPLGVSADAERRVDRRLPAGESRRLELPREARARS